MLLDKALIELLEDILAELLEVDGCTELELLEEEALIELLEDVLAELLEDDGCTELDI